MGREPDSSPMGTFLLISALLHVVVLLFAPQWANRAGAQLPSLLSGGVVQVVRVDEPTAAQRTTPQPVQPERKPPPAPPKPEPKPATAPEPKPTPADRAEQEAPPEPAIQAPAQARPADRPLTSTQGQEPAPEARKPQPAPKPEPKPAPQPSPKEPPADQAAPEQDGAAASTEPASEPVPEDPGPPRLPPLGEPGSLLTLGGTALGYPKNAENQGLEGEVQLRLELDANGQVQRVVLLEPSGHKVLDDYAVRGVEYRVRTGQLHATRQAAPYAVRIRVSFRRDGGAFVGQLEPVGSAEYLQER
ncbi:energy transducer TonB [Limnochorda pilosa]|uniref:TonB C-terminal domain-containing protein n=1 Tax=Limnochorda pilosa TaxID=1555112 RepID=A0A0K2SL34_LIMPI|nr:energy transducer TonB [Limnochorda pilosa]BAS27559.1 hypothetical protein LIP_1713 [Limnochorda pilosa]